MQSGADWRFEHVPPAPDFDPSAPTVLSRPDGRAFSRELHDLAPVSPRGAFLITDSGDRTLWTVQFEERAPRLARVRLRDGDEWSGWDADSLSRVDIEFALLLGPPIVILAALIEPSRYCVAPPPARRMRRRIAGSGAVRA